MSKTRVFVNTNMILEASRINSWAALCDKYAIETVDKCIEETLSGSTSNPKHIAIPARELTNRLAARHNPTKKDIANIRLQYPQTQSIDDGELHLFAWLYAQNILPDKLMLISTADKAAIVSTGLLGWLDSVTSLEKLLINAGVKQQKNNLKKHYKSDWLSKVKIQIRLGIQ